jgi:hypothetical protein
VEEATADVGSIICISEALKHVSNDLGRSRWAEETFLPLSAPSALAFVSVVAAGEMS